MHNSSKCFLNVFLSHLVWFQMKIWYTNIGLFFPHPKHICWLSKEFTAPFKSCKGKCNVLPKTVFSWHYQYHQNFNRLQRTYKPICNWEQLTSAGTCSSFSVYLWRTLIKSFGKYPKICPTCVKKKKGLSRVWKDYYPAEAPGSVTNSHMGIDNHL